MRIVLPQRIKVSGALIFAFILAIVQLLEGTHPSYVLAVFAYFMLSTFAFNIAGGFNRPSGAFIFYYSVLVAGLGTVYKALLGQAADTNLGSSLLQMLLYCGTLVALLVAAYITRKLVTTQDGLAGVLHVPQINFSNAAMGCVVMVVFIDTAAPFFSGFAGSIMHAIVMVNYFLPLGILLGTVAAVRNSGGQRSTSPLVVCAIVYSTYVGLLASSKQGMFTPFVSWIIGLAWAKFSLRLKHLIAIIAFAVVAQEFMVPLANIGREESGDRNAIVEHHLLHPVELMQMNREHLEAYAGDSGFYFGAPQGIFDRLTMLPPDAGLITYTAEGHYFGYLPILYYYQNWVPHIVDPHKLEGISVGGNTYAHELGHLLDADTTTGISFSATAEAFHIDGWFCVLLVQPIIFVMLFITTDGVCGDLRRQPWGLLPVLLFAHTAPEQGLGGPITYNWMGNIGTIFAIFIAGYVAPVFGRLFAGRERSPIWRTKVEFVRGTGT